MANDPIEKFFFVGGKLDGESRSAPPIPVEFAEKEIQSYWHQYPHEGVMYQDTYLIETVTEGLAVCHLFSTEELR